MTKGGFLNACSVSWQPIKWAYSSDKNCPGGLDFETQELLEISAVVLPANVGAMAQGRAAGIDMAPIAAWAERELDLGRSPINRRELEMVRALATPKSRSVHYST